MGAGVCVTGTMHTLLPCNNLLGLLQQHASRRPLPRASAAWPDPQAPVSTCSTMPSSCQASSYCWAK
jgi:hypothetical protein